MATEQDNGACRICTQRAKGKSMAKAHFTYGGRLKHDYTGAHIAYMVNGVKYLGTVTGTYRDEDEVLMFTVKHFNGESAPDVVCGLAWVLVR